MIRIYLYVGMLFLSSCSIVAEKRNWSFIQSVGGIAVQDPSKTSGKWQLPLRADVSGLTTVTMKPTMINSGLTCRSVKAAIEKHVIYLTISTGLINSRRSHICPPAKLGHLKPGTYMVSYRGPDGKVAQLREVVVGL